MKLKEFSSELNEDLTTAEKEKNDRTVSLEEYGSTDQLDSGYGWCIVLASFLMQVCSFGITSGFGVYLSHYRSHVFSGQPDSQISLIGTVAPTTIALASMFTGRLCDKLGFRVCTLMGLGLTVTSFVAASFSTKIWHFILTQGFLFGLGGALLYIPANTVVTRWFIKKRGLAVGIGTAGSGVGGSITSVTNARLLSILSVPWVLRINGLAVGILLIISAIIIRSPRNIAVNLKSSSQSESFKLSMIYNPKFILFFLGNFFGAFAYLVPLYYLPPYAEHVKLSKDQGALLAGAVNIASAFGRVFLGFMGDRLGHAHMFFLCLFSSSILLVIWLFSKSFALLMLFSIIYGLSCGGFAGCFPSTCAVLFGEKHLATIMGIAYAATSLGDLLGPYFAGLILDNSNNYQYLIGYAMVLYGISAFCMLLILIFFTKNRSSSTEAN